jgi:hypothetical protein
MNKRIITVGIVFLLMGCIAQQSEKVLIEPDIPEQDILVVINKWNYELVESYNTRYLPSYMLASLMDPVVYDIVKDLNTTGTNAQITALQEWAQKTLAHTQSLSAFSHTPGNDPWGTVLSPWGSQRPVYKKLLPSEMKAMSMYSGKITGKCMTLASLNACLFRVLGAEPGNALVIKTKTHGLGLAKYGGKIYLTDNNTIKEVDDSTRQWLTSRTFLGLWTEETFTYKSFIINDDVLDSPDTLLDAIWKVNWDTKPPRAVLLPHTLQREQVLSTIFEASESDKLAALAKYAYQSMHVKHPEFYLRASVRAPRAIELAGQLQSVEEIIDWIKKNVSTKSIFEDERIMLADQVIVFKTGGLKDQAVLGFTLLNLKGYNPVITITTESTYIECDGRMYDVNTWDTVDEVTGTVELVLHLNPQKGISMGLGIAIAAKSTYNSKKRKKIKVPS